ncbi:MAG: aldolase/citrate lyase family protein [Bacteroidota bacterium]
MKDLKKRLQRGETLNGCWLNLGISLTAEIVGLAGFDWVLIDLEHGAGAERDVLHQLQALQSTSAAPLVRVENHALQRVHRVLDLGAEGVMCPRINNLAEAQQAVAGWQYPPDGKRGVAKMVRTTQFGVNFNNYYEGAKDNILGIIQIETEEVLNHLDGIAGLDGVDVLFVGPADLSMALGIFGQFDHPRFKEALKATVDAAERAGKATGILLFNPDDYPIYRGMGIRMIASGSDATFVANGARAMVSKLTEYRDSSRPTNNS